ncbi:PREDICTED: solute carrier family 22 member 6-like [Ficedula albicollis]|uniref:solute carrier family 22 member 6-like n=1 Tax=Ficedula albicollis TaxID=59894 RepID=UPI0003598064|nr:PREDICTED: solute carrier family 22 member 6-like [Ficedula albicollis]
MDLQGFGFNVYLSQVVFGAVDIPAKLLSVLVISGLGRRLAQGGALALAGLCILANIFVPGELPALRMAFAVVGKGALAASFNCAYIFTGELFPTVIRWVWPAQPRPSSPAQSSSNHCPCANPACINPTLH